MKHIYFVITLLAVSALTMHCGSPCSDKTTIPQREHIIQSVLWQQNAAEFRALSYQSYHLARLQLDRILKENRSQKTKLAVVADLDETVLDNSRYNGMLIERDTVFTPTTWLEWGELMQADTIPGAVSFFNYAASKGVEAFYISNRGVQQQAVTIQNLQKFNIPFADEDHVLLMDKTSGKEPRRQKVQQTHKIVLLLGDNLADFSPLFDRQRSERRNFLVDSLRAEFGTRFIVFANPVYGDWESKGIYEGRHDWTPAQADSIRRSKIRGY